jgi:hypothetical protein
MGEVHVVLKGKRDITGGRSRPQGDEHTRILFILVPICRPNSAAEPLLPAAISSAFPE